MATRSSSAAARSAENGQIVVALVDENEVTLKRLRKRGASIALEPANARHETRIFPADRVQVQGRMIALLRKYLTTQKPPSCAGLTRAPLAMETQDVPGTPEVVGVEPAHER